jgi:hypothetical protein
MSINLLRLPNDILNHLSLYFEPPDYYNWVNVLHKTNVLTPCYYWDQQKYRKEEIILKAITANCLSLYKLYISNFDILLLTRITNIACSISKNTELQIYAYNYASDKIEMDIVNIIIIHHYPDIWNNLVLTNRWKCTQYDLKNILRASKLQDTDIIKYIQLYKIKGENIIDYIDCIIEEDRSILFNYIVDHHPEKLTHYNLDILLVYYRYNMFAIVYSKIPLLFEKWLFGDSFETKERNIILDTDLIYLSNIIFIHLPNETDKAKFVNMFKEYHDWLWYNTSLDHNIVDVINTILIFNWFKFEPQMYVQSALNSSYLYAIELLLTRELKVDLDLFMQSQKSSSKIRDLIYMKLFINNTKTETFYIILIIILCIIIAYSLFESIKIENKKHIITII